jgi:hypothetical protein
VKFLAFLFVLLAAIVLGGKWLASWAEQTGAAMRVGGRAP